MKHWRWWNVEETGTRTVSSSMFPAITTQHASGNIIILVVLVRQQESIGTSSTTTIKATKSARTSSSTTTSTTSASLMVLSMMRIECCLKYCILSLLCWLSSHDHDYCRLRITTRANVGNGWGFSEECLEQQQLWRGSSSSHNRMHNSPWISTRAYNHAKSDYFAFF